jgi:hypothetical protein
MAGYPKPKEKRQRRNKRAEIGPIANIERTAEPPAPCKTWLVQTKAEWFEFWDDEISSLVRPGEFSAVKRLFDYRDEHARALRDYRAERVTPGSKGQRRLSPMFDALQKLEKMMLPLEDRFALSSLARLRLGVELGSMHRSLSEMNAALDAEVDGDTVHEVEVIELPGLPANAS